MKFPKLSENQQRVVAPVALLAVAGPLLYVANSVGVSMDRAEDRAIAEAKQHAAVVQTSLCRDAFEGTLPHYSPWVRGYHVTSFTCTQGSKSLRVTVPGYLEDYSTRQAPTVTSIP